MRSANVRTCSKVQYLLLCDSTGRSGSLQQVGNKIVHILTLGQSKPCDLRLPYRATQVAAVATGFSKLLWPRQRFLTSHFGRPANRFNTTLLPLSGVRSKSAGNLLHASVDPIHEERLRGAPLPATRLVQLFRAPGPGWDPFGVKAFKPHWPALFRAENLERQRQKALKALKSRHQTTPQLEAFCDIALNPPRTRAGTCMRHVRHTAAWSGLLVERSVESHQHVKLCNH